MANNSKRQLTIEYINSDECPWPQTVKERGREIIQLSASLAARKRELSELDMLEATKIGLMQEVAQLHQTLANAYRNMSKELVYHLSRSTN